MPEPILHMPDNVRPLLPWLHRPQGQKGRQELVLPEAHIWVGRDQFSSGATLTVWEPTAGTNPRYSTLWASRWLEPLFTTETAVRLLANAAAAAVAELFPKE